MPRILLASAALLFALEAAACQCGERPSLQESLGATAIFEGTIVDKRVVFASQYGEVFPAVEYEFSVLRSWKGVSNERVWLLGGYSNCASHFYGNQRYLVFASPHWEEPGALSASICSRTRPISAAADDIRDLGSPRISFRDHSGSRNGLPMSRVIRAHAVAGIAGFKTLSRRPTGTFDYLGVTPLAAAALSICALVVTPIFFRKNRKAALLAAIFFVVLSLVAIALAGVAVLRNPYFGRFVEWQAPEGGV
jgi:hypothetical protein